MSLFWRIVFASVAVLALPAETALAQKADIAGAADHALVGRYEGSVATFYQSKAYEELKLPFKPLQRNDRDKAAWQVDLSGKLTSIRYEGPAGRSILEVMRNYEQALQSKGFEIRLFCKGAKECSPGQSASAFWDAGKKDGSGCPRRGTPRSICWRNEVQTIARSRSPSSAWRRRRAMPGR